MGSKKTIILIYLVLLILSYFIYKPSLSSYFFQDDWFTFKISHANSLTDFLKFFIPSKEVIYYRPFGMQVYFFIMQNLFGINPIYYRLTALFFHSFNALLVFYLLLKMKINKVISCFAGILYATSIASFIPFYWSSTFPFILGVTFFLLAFLFYSKKNRILSFIFYILGLATLEIVIVLPVILLFWEKLVKKRSNFLPIIKYFIVGLIYFILRFLIFSIPLKGTYKFSVNLLPTLRSYLIWSFNWPEEMNKQIVKVFTINNDFFLSFKNYIYVWLTGTLLILFFTFMLPLIINILKKEKLRLTYKYYLFATIWYLLPFALLLLFSQHTYAYYLPISLVGLIIYLSSNLSDFFNSLRVNKFIQIIYLSIIVIAWVNNSLTTMKFNLLGYWVPKTACQSKEVISQLPAEIVSGNSQNVYFRITDIDYKQALNDQDALQVILDDNSIKTVYESETYKGEGKEILIKVNDKNCEGVNKKF